MHLVFENIVKQLILLWTDGIDGLDEGRGSYHFVRDVWTAIGVATGLSGSTIPSVFTGRPPNCAEPKGAATADSWSFWLLYLGPRVLARHFRKDIYYHHFIELSRLVHKCMQFEISREDLADIHAGFSKWVLDFEKHYYQHDPSRVQVCTINVHALLHIADSIEAMGPVWTYWAFPMERYCGRLQRAIRSRRFPWSNLDEHILASAQLAHLKMRYNLEQELSLRPVASAVVDGQYSHKDYNSCILLPPWRPSSSITNSLAERIKIHLGTRYSASKQTVNQVFQKDFIKQYAAVRRLQGGDDMFAAELIRTPADYRDRTFVKYVPLVDAYAHFQSRPERLEPQAHYGQIRNILLVTLPATVALQLDGNYHSDEPSVLFLACIQECDTTGPVSRKLPDAECYTKMKPGPKVFDIATIQCLVGRTPLANLSSTSTDPTEYCIIDRSMGEVNQPIYHDE
ncbi:hypothetical protein EV714DRAFT_215252 [Schizophyllum commune]